MMRFKIMPDGAEAFEVEATSRDLSFWERTVKGASLGSISENPRMCDLEHIAYIACKRRAGYSGTLDDFRASADVKPLDDDESEAGPTQTAP